MKKLTFLSLCIFLIGNSTTWAAGTCSYGGVDCKTDKDCPPLSCIEGFGIYTCGSKKKCPHSSLVKPKQQLQCKNGLCVDLFVRNFKGYPDACGTSNVCLTGK